MIRIMQINAGSKYGGVSAMIYNYYKHIDRNRYQFDFVAPFRSSFELYREEIENMGGRIIELGVEGTSLLYNYRLFKAVYLVCKNNKYQIVHINSGYSLFNFIVAFASHCAGATRILVHSHNAGNIKKKDRIYAKILAGSLCYLATECLACSKAAGEFMFTKKVMCSPKFHILKNGIVLKSFAYDEETRKKIRKSYNIENRFVVGHVGRFTEQKNHIFLLNVFAELLSYRPDAVLVLIGEGEDMNRVQSHSIELGIEKNIIYAGLVKNTNELYSAMDVFVLPSLFEGLPVVGIEAQAAGLKCVFSANVTQEVMVTPSCSMIKLDDDISNWVKEILKSNNFSRNDSIKYLQEAGYDIEDVTRKLETLYSTI